MADLSLCVTIFSCQSAFLTTFKIKIQLQLKLFSSQQQPVLSHNMTDYAKAHMFLFIYVLRKVYLVFYIVREGNVMIFDKRWIVFGGLRKKDSVAQGRRKMCQNTCDWNSGATRQQEDSNFGDIKVCKKW